MEAPTPQQIQRLSPNLTAPVGSDNHLRSVADPLVVIPKDYDFPKNEKNNFKKTENFENLKMFGIFRKKVCFFVHHFSNYR